MRAIVLYALFCVLACSANILSQPYYAATKGISCSVCHVNPSGAGVRKPTEGSVTFINNAIGLGADLRVGYSNDSAKFQDYSFKSHEQRVYLTAEPIEGVSLAYSNESGSTAEAYGMIQKDDWLYAYVRVGRFFLPYGLQISDPDNSAYIKTTWFAPTNVGFSLQPGLTDLGVEVGFAPKKDYFLNLAVTNGSNKSGSGSAKAITGRGGLIKKHFALGLTGFQGSLPSVAGQEEVRYGGFGWARLGSFVVLGEIGQGSDLASSTQTKKFVNASYAEINYKLGTADSYFNNLLLKGKFDYSKTEDLSPLYRYTLGTEWFIKNHFSIEGQYRFLRENPETDNDEALFLTHLWF